MQIKIELLVISILFVILFTWACWFRLTRWIAKRRYKPEDDKGRRAEEKRKSNGDTGRESAIKNPISTPTGQDKPREQELLPTTEANSTGEDKQLHPGAKRRIARLIRDRRRGKRGK